MGKRNGPVWPRLQLSCPRGKGSADSGLATLGAVLGKLSQDHLGVASLKGNFSRVVIAHAASARARADVFRAVLN